MAVVAKMEGRTHLATLPDAKRSGIQTIFQYVLRNVLRWIPDLHPLALLSSGKVGRKRELYWSS